MNDLLGWGETHPLYELYKSWGAAIENEAFWLALRARESRAFLLGAIYGIGASIVIVALSWWART